MKQRGGARPGAGRPKASGRYGEPTKAVRIPLSKLSAVHACIHPVNVSDARIPLYSSHVAAGLPSLVDDHIDRYVDLTTHLIREPAATFLIMANGDSMVEAGIHSGDLLVVDRNRQAKSGRIVIAAVNGELTVKYLRHEDSTWRLLPANSTYRPIDLTEHLDLVIWGVVIHVIHSFT